MIRSSPLMLHFIVSDHPFAQRAMADLRKRLAWEQEPFAVRVWGPGAQVGAVDAALAVPGTRHGVIFLVDAALFPLLYAPPPWLVPLLQAKWTRLIVPLEVPKAVLPRDLAAVQQVGWDAPWLDALHKNSHLPNDREPPATHTEVRVLNALLDALLGPRAPERWFVSHAKADGDAFAVTVQHKLADYGLAAFYDAAAIKAGEDWATSLRQNAGRGMVIVLQSDAYASRPWCQTEMLTAKRQDLPIIVGLMHRQGESRSFPHSGNLRTVALPPSPGAADQAALILIAAALRETLSLACWRGSLDPAQTAGYKILSRPPEPARLVGGEALSLAYLYPDPPLGADELAIVQAVAPNACFKTPQELL